MHGCLTVCLVLFFIFDIIYFGVEAEVLNDIMNNKRQSSVDAKLNLKNDNLCRNNQTFVWCIPWDYNNREEPWRYRSIINASFPWNYHFKFHIFDVQEVNDKKQTVGISMYFGLKWLESRLIINENAADWNDTKYGLPDTVDIAPEVLKNLWNPDLEIYGMASYDGKSALKEMSSIKINKNRHIEYSARVDITISCKMDFKLYPLDAQKCPFRIGSYYSAEDTVNCTYETEQDIKRQRSLQYFLEIGSLPEEYRIFVYENKSYAVCGFHILLARTKEQIFFQVYLTSIMFVVVSWASFIIKPEVVPGRMGVLVTIFLVLINIFNNVKTNAPVSISLNAVDLYLIVCIFIVFLALVEYAIVLFRERYKVEVETSPNEKQHTQNSLSIPNENSVRVEAWPEPHSNANKLDTISLILFPIIFVLFNIIYCVIYI